MWYIRVSVQGKYFYKYFSIVLISNWCLRSQNVFVEEKNEFWCLWVLTQKGNVLDTKSSSSLSVDQLYCTKFWVYCLWAKIQKKKCSVIWLIKNQSQDCCGRYIMFKCSKCPCILESVWAGGRTPASAAAARAQPSAAFACRTPPRPPSTLLPSRSPLAWSICVETGCGGLRSVFHFLFLWGLSF